MLYSTFHVFPDSTAFPLRKSAANFDRNSIVT